MFVWLTGIFSADDGRENLKAMFPGVFGHIEVFLIGPRKCLLDCVSSPDVCGPQHYSRLQSSG